MSKHLKEVHLHRVSGTVIIRYYTEGTAVAKHVKYLRKRLTAILIRENSR